MGAVHGVYLKYVAMGCGSYVALFALAPTDPTSLVAADADAPGAAAAPCWLLSGLAYMCALNLLIAVLFKLEWGMALLGKCEKSGEVPLWSYIMFAGFHFPTWAYTKVTGMKDKSLNIAVADEVAPGWWLGGRYAGALGKKWAGIVDLTCEFPEGCVGASSDAYLLLRCWDGVPPMVEQLERAADFAARQRAAGEIIVHCAHGRGRSTTVMCACLVRAGLYKTWEEAFEGIRQKRKVVKLNKRMREVLTAWELRFGSKRNS
eukprot:TRINITY_DN46834_c0_g1_i1.p1 TRINITY_DN46834_c0_g1~~TRINITY_DN46834_c0_g1_i1.p1  ORF type:complete len:261 (+),score=58.35 TRINITY_DN46834_c0_g1_i1:113-895(+)